MSLEPKQVARISAQFLAAVFAASSAFAHPGSGIVVDRDGQVYFTDTGLGVWKVDLRGRMVRHQGPAYHFMTIDRRGRCSQRLMPRGTGGELYYAEMAAVRRIARDGTVSLVAGDIKVPDC